MAYGADSEIISKVTNAISAKEIQNGWLVFLPRKGEFFLRTIDGAANLISVFLERPSIEPIDLVGFADAINQAQNEKKDWNIINDSEDSKPS